MVEDFSFIPTTTEHQTPAEQGFTTRQPKRRWIKKLFLVLAVFVLILGILSAIGISRFVTGINQGQSELEAAQAAALEFDFSVAGDHLELANEGFTSAQSGLLFLRWTYPVPWLGQQVRAIDAVLSAGIASLEAVEEAIVIASDVYKVVLEAEELLSVKDLPEEHYTFDTFPEETKRELLQTLAHSHPQLKEIQIRLKIAQENLARLHELNNVNPRILAAVEPFEALMPDLVEAIEVILPFSATAEELAGVGADKQWLILFLNNTELRPAGGFIGVYGLMLVRDGEIVAMNVADSYSVDKLVEGNEDYNIPPPAPISEFIGVENWYFRDANWSPDFAVSARDAVQLLRQEVAATGQPAPHIDGVIGITPTFAEAIFDIIGPVTIEDMTFNSENFTRQLEFEVEYGYEDRGISKEHRKAVVGSLVSRVMDELFELPLHRWSEVFTVINMSFQDKQLGLYSFDETTQAAFVDAGWGMTVQTGSADDVLMVVDANLAALKTDPSVERQIKYSIEPQGEDYIATVKIEYNHFGTFDLFTSRYRTFTRIYVPLGSELISHSGSLQNDKLQNPDLLPDDVVAHEDLGLQSFGAFIAIEPGETGELTFTYKLPTQVKQALDENIYQLKLIKQMGATDHILTLDLNFGKKVKVASPAEDPKEFGDDKYYVNTILDQDQMVTVQF